MATKHNNLPPPLALALLLLVLGGLNAAFGRVAPRGAPEGRGLVETCPPPASRPHCRPWRRPVDLPSRLAGAIFRGVKSLHGRILLANALLAVGVLLLIATGGLYAYGLYERYLFDQQPLPTADVADFAAGAADPVPEATPIRLEPVLPADVAPEDRWQLVPLRAEPPLTFLAPIRLVVESIKVDSRIVPAKIVGDTWEVPKFVVGHLQGTALPGQPGNAAFSGHVESISSGNVFAHLDAVAKGDEIVIYVGITPHRYRVTETKVVRNTDVSIVGPTPDERITLLTCTGTWLPLARDYDSRRVVIAKPVGTLRPPWEPPQ